MRDGEVHKTGGEQLKRKGNLISCFTLRVLLNLVLCLYPTFVCKISNSVVNVWRVFTKGIVNKGTPGELSLVSFSIPI